MDEQRLSHKYELIQCCPYQEVGGVQFIVLVQMEVKTKGYKGSSPQVRSLRSRTSGRRRTSGGSGRSGRPGALGRPLFQLGCRRVGRP